MLTEANEIEITSLSAGHEPDSILTEYGHCLNRAAVVDDLFDLEHYLAETLNHSLSHSVTRAGIESFLRDPHLGFFVVALQNEQIIASLEVKSIFEVWDNSPYWYVDNFAVLPQWQREGIGTAMLQHVTKLAKAEGVSRIRLFVVVDSPQTMDFYTKKGFYPVGTFMELPTKKQASQAFSRDFEVECHNIQHA